MPHGVLCVKYSDYHAYTLCSKEDVFNCKPDSVFSSS